jgi:hypothetical protein
MRYLRDWIGNLFIIGLVCLGTLMLAWLAHPNVLRDVIVWGESGLYLMKAFQMWPIVALVLIAATLPRRKKTHHHRFGW